MSENTQKSKKEIIKVEKDFFMKLVEKVDSVAKRLDNIDAMRDVDTEIRTLKPQGNNMTKIIGSPVLDIEVNFIDAFTMDMIKSQGLNFQKELEVLLNRYKIQSVSLNYKREIR
jgi:hypothetical protein